MITKLIDKIGTLKSFDSYACLPLPARAVYMEDVKELIKKELAPLMSYVEILETYKKCIEKDAAMRETQGHKDCHPSMDACNAWAEIQILKEFLKI